MHHYEADEMLAMFTQYALKFGSKKPAKDAVKKVKAVVSEKIKVVNVPELPAGF